MDTRLTPVNLNSQWSGLGWALSHDALQLMAHQQKVRWVGPVLDIDTKVAIYDAKVTQIASDFALLYHDQTVVIAIPDDEEVNMFTYKEMTAGIGGIGIGAQHLGMQCLGTLDFNDMACQNLDANKMYPVIKGDVLSAHDRSCLHACHDGQRGWLFSGFPCQPLSVQGDAGGSNDARSRAFHGVIKGAWEQQVGGLLLECVPGAMTASYVQQELQQFCWSMGMELQQRVLHLHATWPCRRTRWWAMLVPTKYTVESLMPLPQGDTMPALHHIIDRWPCWPEQDEAALALSDEEIQVFHNPLYGDDVRHLRMNQVAPCLLHSYGSVLHACPCGCRGPFNVLRLQRDGVRGFYVLGHQGQPRYLHVNEAAYLCSLRPSMTFPAGPRDSLCLVGQCAAPIQSLWMLSHFLDSHQINPHGTKHRALMAYKELLFREAHGHFRFEHIPFPVTIYADEDTPIHMKVAPDQKISDLQSAERKHLPPDQQVRVLDGSGRLTEAQYLQQAPLEGQYVMQHISKRQAKERETMVKVGFLLDEHLQPTTCEGFFPAGMFLFEIILALGLPRPAHHLLDEFGHLIALDQRIWTNITVCFKGMSAMGSTWTDFPYKGLTDLCLDVVASILIRKANRSQSHFWMPANLASFWFFHHAAHPELAHWALSALHGHLYMAVAWNRHWILLDCFVSHGVLHVHYLDGQEHRTDPNIMQFAKYLSDLLAVSPYSMTRSQVFMQQCPHTCGTILLMHLGERLRLWNANHHPDELQWHHFLSTWLPTGLLEAHGKGAQADDRDLVWTLRDILKEHGVPDDRTEERAKAAIEKIGATRLQEALAARNVWQALKALGSQPRNQFLFVKPDELEKMIRQRAQSRFKINSSDKKVKNSRPKVEASDIDPNLLQLLPGTFEIQTTQMEVKQLPMAEVAAHRSGLAFGRVLEVLPFLREAKSISLDALAILTTSRVAPADQGLLPVVNLRFPAIYIPTQEPILIEGSLINLGDLTVVRRQVEDVIPTAAIPTAVLKLSQYKDEWEDDWTAVVRSPLKTILQKHPLFTLCNGNRCGGNCPRYHPPVDTEIDSVILDVWARSWLSIRGKRVQADQAEVFQVLLRIPEALVRPLQRLSGTSGLYIEPRLADSKGSDSSVTVVWLTNGGLAEAQHRLKMADRGLAIARFANRYGIRVPCKDAEALHVDIHPEVPFHNFEVCKTFELRPLPHGTQKLGVLAMLKAWNWKARPLQPCKADSNGMGWLVGAAEDPPKMLMTTNAGDVVISLHRTHGEGETSSSLTSSAKTQGYLRKQQRTEKGHEPASASTTPLGPPGLSGTSSTADPWQNYDPWSQGRPSRPMPAQEDEPMQAKAMMDSMEERLTAQLTEHTEARFYKIEVDMAEIREQNHRHEGWFQDAAKATQHLQNQVGTLTHQVAQQQQEVSSLSSDIKNGFQSIEALLSKKQRQE